MYSFTLLIYFQILCLFSAWRLPRVSSFVSNSNCNSLTARTSRQCPSISTSLQLVSSKPTGDVESAAKGFFWEFQGHSCYAEVAQPSKIDQDRKKPIALLIHGFACSTVYWRETRTYLTNAGYTVHSVDLLGQGKSSKPGRKEKIEYSIDLWAKMVDDYANRYMDLGDERGVVLVGNSLGSVVALSAASGDCYRKDMDPSQKPFLPSRVKGMCFFNCGIGMNVQNAIKVADSVWQKALVTAIFSALNFLIFNNKPLLTYVLDNLVSKETLRDALLNLYQYAEDPRSRVDDELVDSFLDPVLNDPTPEVVDVLSQIYVNDAGTLPMEMQTKYLSDEKENQSKIPIHLIWGDQDPIAPITGDVGRFYSKLATIPDSAISIEVVKDAGHVLFDERPECNEGLIEWLAHKF